MRLQMFVSTVPGLEPLLAREVAAIAEKAEIVPGGVETEGDQRTLARLLVELGLASHVLVRVASFRVKELSELEAHVGRLPWSGWLRRDEPRRLRVRAQGSRLYHTGAIEERVVRGIQKRLGDAPREAEPEACVPIHVRMLDDRCTISLDASGTPLHRRSYRLDPYRAPLREDLARALVIASGWDPSRPFLDPMCGSGTLAIEAALIATDRAPGLQRTFAMERTALDDGTTLTAVRRAAQARIRPAPSPILARDRDARAVAAARGNAERALGEDVSAIRFEVQPLSTAKDSLLEAGVALDAGIAIVTNPPWGERLGDASALKPLYQALGSLVRGLPGSTLALAAHDRRLAYATGVPIESAFLSDLGGLKVAAMISKKGASLARSGAEAAPEIDDDRDPFPEPD